MIVITQHNIEEYIINSIEKLLTPAEEAALQQYILVHPEAHKLYDEYTKTVLEPEAPIRFPFKSTLFKQDTAITNDTIDERIISSIEKLLSPTEEAALQQYIQIHPEAHHLYTQYQKTILSPEPVSFPYKAILYKKEAGAPARILWMPRAAWVRVAAILVLALSAMGIWHFLQNNSYKVQHGAAATHLTNNTIVHATVPSPKMEVKQPMAVQYQAHKAQPVTTAKINTNFDAEAQVAIIRRRAQADSTQAVFVMERKASDDITPMPQASMAHFSVNHIRNNLHSHSANAVMTSYHPDNTNVLHGKDVASATVHTLYRLVGYRDDNVDEHPIRAIHVSYNSDYVKFDKTITLK